MFSLTKSTKKMENQLKFHVQNNNTIYIIFSLFLEFFGFFLSGLELKFASDNLTYNYHPHTAPPFPELG